MSQRDQEKAIVAVAMAVFKFLITFWTQAGTRQLSRAHFPFAVSCSFYTTKSLVRRTKSSEELSLKALRPKHIQTCYSECKFVLSLKIVLHVQPAWNPQL